MPHLHVADLCLDLVGDCAGRPDLFELYRPYMREGGPCSSVPTDIASEEPAVDPCFELHLEGAWLTFSDRPGPNLRVGGASNFRQVDRLLMHGVAGLLIRQGGLLVHGAAVEGPRGAIAFLGAAGAGKTTAAMNCPARLLHPDRVAVGVGPGGPWLAPVPFLYGEPRTGSSGSLRLDRIVFVEKGDINSLMELPVRDKATRMLGTALVPPARALAETALANVEALVAVVTVHALRARREGGFWPLLADAVATVVEVE